MSRISRADKIIVGIFFVVSVCVIFWRAQVLPFRDWDEAIYANIAGEMVTSHQWFHMNLQGTPWYEKEILPYWLMAGGISLFGYSVSAIRGIFAFAGSLIFPLTYIITRYYVPKRWAIITTLFFLSSPLTWQPHVLGTGDFDALALCFFLLSIVSYLYLRHTRYWWVSTLFLALGLMSRGVMGLIPLAIILSAEIFRRIYKMPYWGAKKIVQYTIGSLIPWLTWHIYWFIEGKEEYINIYWKEQFFSRITGPLQGHAGTITFYADHIRHTAGPIFFTITIIAIILCFYSVKNKSWPHTVLLLWLFFTLTPLHILQTKLEWYILPALPALFIVIIVTLNTLLQKKFQRFPYSELFFISIFYIHIITTSFFLTQDWPPKNDTLHDFIISAESYISSDTIILYNLGGWYKGLVLPTYYWYFQYEQEIHPIMTDDAYLKTHLDTFPAIPYWMVYTKDIPLLETYTETFSYDIVYDDSEYSIIHITPQLSD